jgi:hypothetical protein
MLAGELTILSASALAESFADGGLLKGHPDLVATLSLAMQVVHTDVACRERFRACMAIYVCICDRMHVCKHV